MRRLANRNLFNYSFHIVRSIVRLTSVTPGRPDDRALGVQLPHSLSDPRTSPFRSSRRGGKNVQFGYQCQPPTVRRIFGSACCKSQNRLLGKSPVAKSSLFLYCRQFVVGSCLNVARSDSQRTYSKTQVVWFLLSRSCTCKWKIPRGR